MIEITKEDYVRRYSREPLFEKTNMLPEDVWTIYHKYIFPYLAIITEFRLHDNKSTHEELRIALGIPRIAWRIAKKTFKGLRRALNADRSVMKLKAQLDLQKGLSNTEYKNPKMIEMQGLRYDDGWKVKGDKEVVELPKTITIVTKSAKLSDEERIEKSQIEDS